MYFQKQISTAVCVSALLMSFAALAQTPSTPVSDGGITPSIIPGANPGGNRNCAEVGYVFFGNSEYYQCYSQKQDFNGGFADDFENISDNPDCDQDIEVEVTGGTYVEFWAEPYGIGAAIIKGSNNANIYVYDPQSNHDFGLASPPNASGNPAGLSNIGGFCWNPTPPGDEPGECFEGETAWADGTRYNRRGNWATYTTYGQGLVVVLFAGKHMDAGDVTFSPPVAGVVTITIDLNPGWRFALVPVGEEDGQPIYDNNVKVQDYASAPSGNPAPGLFNWKKFAEGDSTTIEVPLNTIYGVHVDVEHEVPCPE